jgi:hypothetical protein
MDGKKPNLAILLGGAHEDGEDEMRHSSDGDDPKIDAANEVIDAVHLKNPEKLCEAVKALMGLLEHEEDGGEEEGHDGDGDGEYAGLGE